MWLRGQSFLRHHSFQPGACKGPRIAEHAQHLPSGWRVNTTALSHVRGLTGPMCAAHQESNGAKCGTVSRHLRYRSPERQVLSSYPVHRQRN